MTDIKIKDAELAAAAADGMDEFLGVVVKALRTAIGGELSADNMGLLTGSQITLLAWDTLHEELMDGGFIQLIHNGYGPFIFLNPFAKAMRLWGLKDLSKLIYDGRRLWEQHRGELEADCTDEEFMALYEQHPEFDDLDDQFVENEEEWTAQVAHYVDEHLSEFGTIV